MRSPAPATPGDARALLGPDELASMSDDDLRMKMRKLVQDLADVDKRLRSALEERERLRTEKELFGLQVEQLVAVIKHDDSKAPKPSSSTLASLLPAIPPALLGLGFLGPADADEAGTSGVTEEETN